MAVRSCRVTIEGTDGISHTVEVTAGTLYEAVAQGLAALRGREWVDGLPQGHNIINVAVAEVPVVHQVKVIEFTKRLADGRFAVRWNSEAAHSGNFGHAEFSAELTLEALTYR